LPTNITTNSSGVVELNQEFRVDGTYNISAFWDATGSIFADLVNLPLVVTASADSFTITVTDSVTGDSDVVGIDPGFGNIRAEWRRNGLLVSPATITPTTNKGTIAVLNPGRNPLNATIRATVPGPATITATGTAGTTTVSVQRVIQFVATVPAELSLQANPSSISANVPGATSSQSEIVATVRDVNGNPVANRTVAFEILQDVSGGSLTASTATTDFAGRAVLNYTAGTSSTPENGVRIRATVSGFPLLTREVTLTVAGTQVFITLGTGNTIVEPDPTTYELPYSVLVNDISGLPVANRTVTLQVFSTTYSKGFYEWNGTVWEPTVTATCPNEDLYFPVGDPRRNNGRRDDCEDGPSDQCPLVPECIPPTSDSFLPGVTNPCPNPNGNRNLKLDPGNPATTSLPSVVTNASGFGFFDVLYAQQYTNWVAVQLTARSQVGGTESRADANFRLQGIASDFNKEDVDPPGNPSPFGTGLPLVDGIYVNGVCTNDL
jgi:hypothetical protein